MIRSRQFKIVVVDPVTCGRDWVSRTLSIKWDRDRPIQIWRSGLKSGRFKSGASISNLRVEGAYRFALKVDLI
jgi:hypothetical protein